MQKNGIAQIGKVGHPIPTDGNPQPDRQPPSSRNPVTSRVPLPKLRYTLPDFDRTWRGKFLQMIIDRLHSRGD